LSPLSPFGPGDPLIGDPLIGDEDFTF
jgi:hypothetical protein